MAQCIVCKGHYDPKTKEKLCVRCGTSNTAWEAWQRRERQQGLVRNLWDFTKPVWFAPLWLPLALAVLLLLVVKVFFQDVGLIGWSVVAACLAAAASLVIAVSAHSRRFHLHEKQLIRTLRGQSSNIDTVMLLAPAGALILAVLLSSVLLVNRIPPFTGALEHAYPKRLFLPVVLVERTPQFPQLTLLLTYFLVVLSLAPLAILGAARAYSNRLSQTFPQPIFLQPIRLADLVKREAANALHCPVNRLQWTGMERTGEGGIRLSANRKLARKVIEDLKGKKTDVPVIRKYKIEADPWGRLTAIRER